MFILSSLNLIAFDSVGRTAVSPEKFCHGFAKDFYKKYCVGRSNDKKAFQNLLREDPLENELTGKYVYNRMFNKYILKISTIVINTNLQSIKF